MKISREWLQTYFENPLPSAEELGRALTFHAFEIDGIEKHQADDVLDVKVTPNRGHDCLSHRGIAKELSAILNLPLKAEYYGFTKPVIVEPKAKGVSVHIEDATLCRRYIAGYIKGIKVGPSPEWLVDRLHAMGQQSINNVVDATNFVMFDLGQPLHAFDAEKLSKNIKDGPLYSIEVRCARRDERMLALDDKAYTLDGSILVIADAYSDISLGIAGVKGGMASGIDERTSDIIIESANFDGVSVRKTAQALKLRTDASQRFEQQISPELAPFGMHAAAELIQQLAGGELVGFVDIYPTKQDQRTVEVTLEKINAILGIELTAEAVQDVFSRLGFTHNYKGRSFIISVPFERLDLEIPEDLVEEIGRIIGYDKVEPQELPPFTQKPEVNQNFATSERVREELVVAGYSEVYTSVFSEEGERAVANKVGGEKPYLRTTLTNGLTEALKKNIQNKDLLGLPEVKLFEIGTVWRGGRETMMMGTVSEKEKATEKPLAEYFQNRLVAYDELPLSATERYNAFSRYPYIVRDVALWTPKDTDSDAVIATIREHAGELLVRAELFDRFEKGERISLAFRLVFQSFDRTLTDEDANQRMESIYAALKKEGFEIR